MEPLGPLGGDLGPPGEPKAKKAPKHEFEPPLPGSILGPFWLTFASKSRKSACWMVLFGGPCPGFVFTQILDGFSIDFESFFGCVFDAAVDVFSGPLQSENMLKPSAGAIESHVRGFSRQVVGSSFQAVFERFFPMVAECRFGSHLWMLFGRFWEPFGLDWGSIGAQMAKKEGSEKRSQKRWEKVTRRLKGSRRPGGCGPLKETSVGR